MQDTVDQEPARPRTLPKITRHGPPAICRPYRPASRCGCAPTARTDCTGRFARARRRGLISKADTAAVHAAGDVFNDGTVIFGSKR